MQESYEQRPDGEVSLIGRFILANFRDVMAALTVFYIRYKSSRSMQNSNTSIATKKTGTSASPNQLGNFPGIWLFFEMLSPDHIPGTLMYDALLTERIVSESANVPRS